MTGRIVLVLTSPRTTPGLLSWPAWQALHAARTVYAADPDPSWLDALAAAGVTVHDLAGLPVAERAARLVAAAGETVPEGAGVAWFGSPDGDPGLTDALAIRLARLAQTEAPPEVELLVGAHDVAGARLLDLVAVMDRLRSPGGCPWDAEQTHLSLLPYLLEETHEVIEAIERPVEDPERRAHLVEELGDLLLQVMFHARLGEEDATEPFDIDEVAAGIVAKLVRRHPHVFAEIEVDGAAEVVRNWEQIKAEEKQRTGLFDGIPASLPALSRAQKVLGRLPEELDDAALDRIAGGDPLAAALLAAVRRAQVDGVEAESVLRAALARWEGETPPAVS